MSKQFILVTALAIAGLTGSVSLVAGQQQAVTAKQASAMASATASVAGPSASARTGGKLSAASHGEVKSAKAGVPVRNEPAAERIEGEKRFRANCGRCHQSPHKFPPREMATIIRHMRVRATITDEDMRLILQYMTQ
ncbi:MAG TPA: cytochrome c [Candidatus Acidoferrales bacterium]|nr:cytochrome c [Candidatus Acidoferrales bacterium]